MNALHMLWLGEPAARDVALVGGKVATLSLLAGAYWVPEGFCLTAAPFERSSQSPIMAGDRHRFFFTEAGVE